MDAKTMRNLRLTGQFLAGSDQPDIATLIDRMAALQAQDYYGSLWAVGVRSGLSEAEVVAALEALQLVRTWPQRGTLHLVAPQDVTWMTGLSAEKQLRGAIRRHENLKLDAATLERACLLFAQALEGGKRLSRPEMLEILEREGISAQSGRGYHMLWVAAQRSLIYIGPMRDKQQTFGLVADLPVVQRQLDRSEAIAELTKRFYNSRGPATVQDLMWWAGLTSAEVKAGIAANGQNLRSVVYEGVTYWLSSTVEPSERIPQVLLLAGFDEYLLGYKDRSLQALREHQQKIVPGSNGMFMPTVLLDGMVTGIWKREIKSTKQPSVQLRFEHFAAPPPHLQAELAQCIEAYGRFLGLPVQQVY